MDFPALREALEKALLELNAQLGEPNPQLPDGYSEAFFEHRLSEDLRSILAAQPEFSRLLMINSFNGAFGFQSQFVAPLLLREARSRGSAKAAVSWLDKVLATEAARGLVVHSLWGVVPDKPLKLADTIDLVPFGSLPASRQKSQLSSAEPPGAQRIAVPMFSSEPPTAALVATVEVNPVMVSTPAENLTVPPIENLTDRRGDEPQFVVAS